MCLDFHPRRYTIAAAIMGIWSNIGYDHDFSRSSIHTWHALRSCRYRRHKSRRFFYITIPQISPVLFLTVMRTMNSINSLIPYTSVDRSNQAFRSTQTLMVQFYIEAFQKYNQGYGAAIAAWMFVIIMLITVIQFIGEKKLVHYT